MTLILRPSLTSCCASASSNRHFLRLPHHTLSKSVLLHPIKSQKSSSSSDPPISTQSTDDISSTGLESGSSNRKKSKKGRKVIRRAPVQTPKAVSKQEEKVEEQSSGEKAFLLAWSGVGSIIILEGLVLAASGFLPEEWDSKIVKYIYPAFTPTVFLFVAGTVVYGVLKYLQNEKPQSSK